jgi:mono/diheme cytochrome c family protein
VSALVWTGWRQGGGDEIVKITLPDLSSPALLERGAYVARAGNCMGCHSDKGGAPFAGGRAIQTPFGAVFASNLTPDPTHGLGGWSASDFWRAMHHGRSKDGRMLYPVFPYPNYTQVSRDDSDALFAFLQSLPPASQANRKHELRWPFSTQPALAVWRALYFSPTPFVPEPAQSADWNRGAYLVQGLGHCAACHASRNALGGSSPLDLAGGLIPMQNWYAPSLNSPAEAGVSRWPQDHVVALLKTGTSPSGSVQGPMAEVVVHSTQHLLDSDLRAMAVFLQSLPERASDIERAPVTRTQLSKSGGQLYDKHCAQCHGESGQGVPNAYPALAGNRAVNLASTVNLVQVVLHGGYPPATAGNPRPYGMPPYVMDLNDKETASVLSYIRGSWGNQATEVTAVDVNQARQRSGR